MCVCVREAEGRRGEELGDKDGDGGTGWRGGKRESLS